MFNEFVVSISKLFEIAFRPCFQKHQDASISKCYVLTLETPMSLQSFCSDNKGNKCWKRGTREFVDSTELASSQKWASTCASSMPHHALSASSMPHHALSTSSMPHHAQSSSACAGHTVTMACGAHEVRAQTRNNKETEGKQWHRRCVTFRNVETPCFTLVYDEPIQQLARTYKKCAIQHMKQGMRTIQRIEHKPYMKNVFSNCKIELLYWARAKHFPPT